MGLVAADEPGLAGGLKRFHPFPKARVSGGQLIEMRVEMKLVDDPMPSVETFERGERAAEPEAEDRGRHWFDAGDEPLQLGEGEATDAEDAESFEPFRGGFEGEAEGVHQDEFADGPRGNPEHEVMDVGGRGGAGFRHAEAVGLEEAWEGGFGLALLTARAFPVFLRGVVRDQGSREEGGEALHRRHSKRPHK